MKAGPLLAAAAMAAACSACGAGSGTRTPQTPIPTPIGRGPAFSPPPEGRREPVPSSLACIPGRLEGRFRAHVEIFARGRVVVVPAGIGVAAPRRHRLGEVVGGRCGYPLRTLDPTGVVHFDRRGLTLGDLFAVWRMPLSPRRLLSFGATRRATVVGFVNGARFHGDVRRIALRDRDEIVLEIGGFVPPHRSYLFTP